MLLLGLPMTVAVGTSLLVVVVNSAAGFAAHAGDTSLDYRLAVVFTLAAVNWLGSGHPRWPPDCPPTGCAAGSPSWSWRFAEFVVAQALLKAAAVAG